MQKKIMHNFLKNIQCPALTVQYWDGVEKEYGDGNPILKIIFNEPFPSSFDISEPMQALGEAYMDDIIDFEGEFDEVMKMIKLNKELLEGKNSNFIVETTKLLNKIHLKEKQKENIHQHYDLGNDFFSLWLDETMSYSCGYFKDTKDNLKEAQLNKIDYILEKLQLKQGERLLDIGSGWGWLIIRAAQKYGVKATGITISEEQYNATVERIESLGLIGQVEIKLQDYLDLDPTISRFDKIVSVGMFEHVVNDIVKVYHLRP